MSTGQLDWLGAEQNITLLAGSTREHELIFTADGEPMELSDVTFDGIVIAADGSTTGIETSHITGETGHLRLVYPALAAGQYRYEIRATDDSGERRRLLFGTLGVLSTSLDLSTPDAETQAERLTLEVLVPGRDARRIMLEWHATTAALRAAEQAASVVNSVADLTAEAKGYAAAAAASAEQAQDALADTAELYDTAAERITALEQQAQDAVALVESMEGRLDAIDEHIRDSIVPNTVTGTWWIAGVDTHYPVQGEDGHSPYISASSGCWVVWDDNIKAYVDTGINPAGKPGVSPIIAANGNWARWDEVTEIWVDTGVQAQGRDGLDGTAIRRIRIDTIDDLPADGERGVYYYIPYRDEAAAAVITVLETGRSASDTLRIDGQTVPLPDASAAPEAAASTLTATITAAFSDITALADGAQVRLTSTRDTLTVSRSGSGYHVLEIPKLDGEGYRVFAWLETPAGDADWVQVGNTNDLATSQIYGLVKTGTDTVITSGAPVGNNADGQLMAPLASPVLPGTVLPSLQETITSGTLIGLDDAGRMYAQLATTQIFGGVKLSFGGEVCNNYGTIGLRADGTLGIPWATLYQPGIILLGSALGQLNPIPYQVGVGATPDHKLANNLLYGGAIQHMRPAGWTERDMSWLATIMEAHPDKYPLTEFSLGLATSNQFTQCQASEMADGAVQGRLHLNAATNTLLAGVYIASGMTDSRPEAVPTPQTITSWSLSTHYTKLEIDTKVNALSSSIATLRDDMEREVNTLTVRFQNYSTTAQMQDYVTKKLTPYETTSSLLSRNYAPRTYVDTQVSSCLKTSPGLQRIYVLTPDEFESSRGSREPDALYIKATM